MQFILQHPLIVTLRNLKGNPRISVFTEPLWGIPFNLYGPYVSVYMLALGVKDAQIGLITSLGLLIQPIFALLSGAITDKYGRRWTTFISDLICWSIPALILTFAQDIRYFIVATLFNATWRISVNSWTCLMVEDADEDDLVHIWTWVNIAGFLTAFVTPLAGLLVGSIGLVAAVRIFYFFAFIMMTLKSWLLFKHSTETQQGLIRLAETQNQSVFALLKDSRRIIQHIFHTPRTMLAMAIMMVLGIVLLINNTFWSILATERLNFPVEHLALFSFAKTSILLILYFIVVPRLNVKQFRNPFLFGFGCLFGATLLLITMPAGNYPILLLSVLLEAIGLTLVEPLLNAVIIISIDSQERARINSIMAIFVILLTSPFGWIAGQLSEKNRLFPFELNFVFLLIGMGLIQLAWRHYEQSEKPEPLDQ